MNTTFLRRPSFFLRLLAAAVLPLFALAAGCEHDSIGDLDSKDGGNKSSTSSSSSAIVGSWRLVSASGSAWYAHFAKDGTWTITDDAAGNARRVYGTYSCDGSRFSGPMVNPHVGEGKIEGTVKGGTMDMDFIEYWHSPAKHVPYTGTKL